MSFIESSLFVNTNTEDAFKLFMSELQINFLKSGVQIEEELNGMIKKGNEILGKVLTIEPAKIIQIEWISPNPERDENLIIEIFFESHNSGTLVRFKPKNFVNHFDKEESELAGWFVDKIILDIFKNIEPENFGDWKTDRSARRPTGINARKVYGNPLYHWPNFYLLLETMHLTPLDYLLEIGCGGGVLLSEVLKTGCKAVGIDHSPEMISLARANNLVSIENGKLEVILGDAGSIPFHDNLFSVIVMTGVFQFLPNPDVVLQEILRVLKPKGRLYIFAGSKEMKGTVAAPEPFASRLRFYEKDELKKLVSEKGYSKVEVEQPDLLPYAKRIGIPESDLFLFDKKYSLLVEAEK